MGANIRVKSLRGFLIGITVTLSGWCISALAASGADIGCNGADRQLQTLTVSATSLEARPVDHLPVGQKSPGVAAEPAESVSKAAAPVLQLAPHIAAMLNTVFERYEEPAVAETEGETKDKSPTAGRSTKDQEMVDDALPGNVSVIVPSDDIARFQRQMYRKDI